MPTRKFKTVTDFKNLEPGTKVYGITSHYCDWKKAIYLFRAGTVPGIRKWTGGPGQSSQRHHAQLKEHYASKSVRLRMENWETDYCPIRVDPRWLDPWDYERQRKLTRSWKAHRKTQYRE
jgi:hypothetical protein